jgi:UDP-N-acetylmuramate--alanine ligase
VCADDPIAARLGRAHGAVLYGTSPEADVRIVDPVSERAGGSFTLVRGEEVIGDVRLPVPGLHNMRNATAAVVAAMALGATFESCQAALARYAGVARRFQYKGRARGVTFVDDYAHNPGKVRALLEAAQSGGWRRVVCAFQPHRYSRTAALAPEFGAAFDQADVVAIMDVYAAGEPPQPGVTGKLVVDAVLDHRPWKHVAWVPGRQDMLTYLAFELRPDDLCLTVGAGDITSLSGEVIDRIS